MNNKNKMDALSRMSLDDLRSASYKLYHSGHDTIEVNFGEKIMFDLRLSRPLADVTPAMIACVLSNRINDIRKQLYIGGLL